MKKNKLLKLVIFGPINKEKIIRETIEKLNGGRVGNYSGWTFTSRGITRVQALDGAKPAIGKVGFVEKIEEFRMETTCHASELSKLVEAIKKVHPYEQVPIDVLEILEV
jgi:hypothetical protein